MVDLRLAHDGDLPGVTDFLRRHEPSSIFPLANLAGAGPSPQQIWVTKGDLTGVIALGSSGFLMPQWPGLDAGAVARALSGQKVSAAIGDAAQIDALAGLLPEPRLATREPLCVLDLDRLVMPDCRDVTLRPLTEADAETAIAFRMDYDAETMAQPASGARAKAEGDVRRWLQAGTHRLLWRAGEIVAMTGLNARLPDVVQVGGVFTPPLLRDQGLARRAVALHLAEARAGGARRAVLFAANEAAFRAYRALGFRQVGWMSLLLLHKAVTL